jgi:hypothetical protein
MSRCRALLHARAAIRSIAASAGLAANGDAAGRWHSCERCRAAVIGLAILAASPDKYAPDAVQTAASAFSSLEAVKRLPDDRVAPLAKSASPSSYKERGAPG